MSQTGQQTTLSNLSERSYPAVTNLTLLVLLLIPCVVLLLLLNCVFLGYKLLIMSKKNAKKREDEEMLLQSTLSTRHRVVRTGDVPCFPNQDGAVRTFVSGSEPEALLLLQPPVTSSRTSTTTDQRLGLRFLRPDGATGTGSGSLRAPSTILATSRDSTSLHGLPRSHHGMSHKYCRRKMDWHHSAPVLHQYSDSEAGIKMNNVPPNSPEVTQQMGSMLDLLTDVQQQTCLNSSTVDPGLDSDFGASAGVSLRILSADSDGLLPSNVLASVLEWDYYDPCYVRQNRIPKQNYHVPSIHPKQYWV